LVIQVGYGDLFPITTMGYMVGALTILAGMMTLALPITIISANFDDETREHNRQMELSKRRAAQRRRLARSYSKHAEHSSKSKLMWDAATLGAARAAAEAAKPSPPGEADGETTSVQQRGRRAVGWRGVSIAPAPPDSLAVTGVAAGGKAGRMASPKTSSYRASAFEEMWYDKRKSRWGQLGYTAAPKKVPTFSMAAAREQLEEEVGLFAL
jgi:hypothetical protein